MRVAVRLESSDGLGRYLRSRIQYTGDGLDERWEGRPGKTEASQKITKVFESPVVPSTPSCHAIGLTQGIRVARLPLGPADESTTSCCPVPSTGLNHVTIS